MKRIGIAASKIAKGNIFVYHVFVFILSALFSILVFFLSAFSVIIALVLVAYASSGFTSLALGQEWFSVFKICMAALAIVVAFFNVIAILVNVKLK